MVFSLEVRRQAIGIRTEVGLLRRFLMGCAFSIWTGQFSGLLAQSDGVGQRIFETGVLAYEYGM